MADDTPVTVAVTFPPPNLPTNFGIVEAAALARDLAVALYDRDAILNKFQISEAQCQALEAHPHFQKLLTQAAAEWHAPSNIRDRLALEAAVGLELSIPTLVSRMKDKGENLASVAQTAKILADIAGASNQNRNQIAQGEKFVITINLGGDKQVFEKTVPVYIDATPEPDAGGESPVAQAAPAGPLSIVAKG